MSVIETAKLKLLCDPFKSTPWGGWSMTMEEIASVSKADAISFPFNGKGDPEPDPNFLGYDREYHIRRVAWLVFNGWDDEIQIDVGIPGICEVSWPITDGNHRFAAALYRNDKFIEAGLSGSCDLLLELFGTT